MTVEELFKKLEKKEVPESAYSLNGGFPNDAYCLFRNELGWEVYYSEGGEKKKARQFFDESSACQYLYDKVKKLGK